MSIRLVEDWNSFQEIILVRDEGKKYYQKFTNKDYLYT